ncbi:DUF6392 family protein [Hafnia paralvei]|uniref:DUF6392 family protein n=1 Tax=Hafnia paralvei TaxID=546367 RepID=UPI003CFAC984
MTVNVEALIRSLGNTYQDIVGADLIPYKTKPTGFSGGDFLSLDMVKEGVYLAFKRDGKYLFSITVTLRNSEDPSYSFPNELPTPLQKRMSIQGVHEAFGLPDKSISPRRIGRLNIGLKERYTLEEFHIPVVMEVTYDLAELVESITFMPTSELRW